MCNRVIVIMRLLRVRNVFLQHQVIGHYPHQVQHVGHIGDVLHVDNLHMSLRNPYTQG